MNKTAIVTGVTGQDGAYLCKLLVEKGYKVYGTYRRSSTYNLSRLEYLGVADRVEQVGMELLEAGNVSEVIRKYQPDELYNLAAQSFVQASFEQPLFTTEVNALGVTRILEAIRLTSPQTRFYQASTSEMFGSVKVVPQNEKTPFFPRSPYGVSKLYGHWITVNYREAFNLYACSGILFNHESPLRGQEFVTRKITHAFAGIKKGQRGAVELGNLDAQRDWGFAADYVEGMWRMLQQAEADDYVLATGETRSIRQFVETAAQALDVGLVWKGKGLDEKGVDKKTGAVWVAINPKFYRPAEVDLLIGDPSKAKEKLGWAPKTSFQELVRMMVNVDLGRWEQAVPQLKHTA